MACATIQKILNILPIENSDFLELVKVLGWQVVVKKGEFNIGDLCVYVELDSLLDKDNPDFAFMEKNGFRVRTVKLRGALSQGIVFPVSILNIDHSFITEGFDVSEYLKITHYEKPVPANMGGLVRGNFPPYVPKTDEPRIQNAPGVIDELEGILCVATVKCDGTSWTCSYRDGDFHVCTRNNSLKLEGNDTNLYVQMAIKYNMREKLEKYGKNIAIQGELVGPGIQKNHMGLKEHKVLVFSAWFIDEARYASWDELNKIIKDLELEAVPVEAVWVFTHCTIENLLEKAEGTYNGTNNPREGIVIRPAMKEMYSKTLKGRMSFKVLNNTFLLKNKE